MAKRKRDEAAIRSDSNPRKAPKPTDEPAKAVSDDEIAIQIVTGSYERVLHGITATIPRTALSESSDKQDAVQFADAFLFNAHASAIRSLALSPISDDAAQSQNVILASGGTDERINLYTLSTSPTPTDDKCPSVPTLTGNKILENPRNRELGSLLHHSSTITALYFPTRSKLLAAAEDNTISVTRLKDLTVVSTIKAPRPKAQGRPSGDTAPVGGAPSGVNDFAVHPSMKLMLSVGRGEKCMRLWNLVTGKKAGVLNFGREVLEVVKEGKWGSGEGRKIVWDSTGEEFAVSFDRGVVVFGVDSVPRCHILPSPLTKVHQIRYIQVNSKADKLENELLAVSTEDGRILFYSTGAGSLLATEQSNGKSSIPAARLWCQLDGKTSGQSSRIKDFEILTVKSDSGELQTFVVVTAGSDGAIKLWMLNPAELCPKAKNKKNKDQKKQSTSDEGAKSVGRLLGMYETGSRITCLKAFVMNKASDDDDFDEFSGLSDQKESEPESSSEEDEDD